MRTILGFFWVLFLLGLVLGIAQVAGMKEDQTPAVTIVFLVGYWLLRRRKKRESANSKANVTSAAVDAPNQNGARYVLKGVNDVLEVFEDKITITPKTNFSSMIVRGLKGSKSIPIFSITAIQFREAKPINGYIQFTLPGGIESKGGVFAAIGDENTVFFVHTENELANKIRDFIESRMSDLRTPKTALTVNIADELQKLAALKAQGILSDDEFTAAKKNLIR